MNVVLKSTFMMDRDVWCYGIFGAIKHLPLKKKCIEYTLKALSKNKGVQKNSLLFKKETHLFESKEALPHGNKSNLGKTKILYQRRPVFVSFPVTKPVVTKCTTLGIK